MLCKLGLWMQRVIDYFLEWTMCVSCQGYWGTVDLVECRDSSVILRLRCAEGWVQLFFHLVSVYGRSHAWDMTVSFPQELSLNRWQHTHSLAGHLTISPVWSGVADSFAGRIHSSPSPQCSALRQETSPWANNAGLDQCSRPWRFPGPYLPVWTVCVLRTLPRPAF